MSGQEKHGFGVVIACAAFALAGAAGASDPPPIPSFTDVTPEPLKLLDAASRGASWGDFNNDGELDLYVTRWGTDNQLFMSLGGGAFVNITYDDSNPSHASDLNQDGTIDGSDLGLLLLAWGLCGQGECVEDIDGDGVVDGTDLGLLLLAWGELPPISPLVGTGDSFSGRAVWGDIQNNGWSDLYVAQSRGSFLLRNDLGEFVNITTGPLTTGNRAARGAAWADYDNDGYIDLYVSAYHGNDNRSFLFRNNGDGTFTDVTSEEMKNFGVGRGVAWADYNNNGLMDLFVANGAPGGDDDGRWNNRMFRNNGDGTFTDVSAESGLDDNSHSRGAAWGDYNNNGLMDLYVSNLFVGGEGGFNKLYRNNGDGTFTDVTEEAGLIDQASSRDCAWIDYDNDGWLDLFVTNLAQENRLYKNMSDGTFIEVTPPALVDNANGRSAAWADFNFDGRLDVYLANGEGANRLVRNDEDNGNGWVQVLLTGIASNRQGIGARITVEAGGLTQIREVQAGSGYQTQHQLAAHFGLGQAQVIDTLTIRWPSGIVQTFTQVPANQHMNITELLPPGWGD